jgi:hypothetical protein
MEAPFDWGTISVNFPSIANLLLEQVEEFGDEGEEEFTPIYLDDDEYLGEPPGDAEAYLEGDTLMIVHPTELDAYLICINPSGMVYHPGPTFYTYRNGKLHYESQMDNNSTIDLFEGDEAFTGDQGRSYMAASTT